MSTPSERLWALGADPDDGPSLRSFLPVRPRDPMTLAGTARRMVLGVTLREAVADFLDDLQFVRDEHDVADRIRQEPPSASRHADAYLAALAEHEAASRRLPTPRWARDAGRFLDHFWWPSTTPGLRARALVESPAAFRRRGIFIGRSTLRRV